MRWIVDRYVPTRFQVNVVHHTRCSSYKRESEFPFETFMDNFHVKQTEKTASKPEAEGNGGLRFKIEGRIVET